mgnify:CR=1 FL=1
MTVSPEVIAAVPKVLLHEHLDGSLRPQTVLELADRVVQGQLGMSVSEVSAKLARRFQLRAGRGVVVTKVQGGMAAARARLSA